MGCVTVVFPRSFAGDRQADRSIAVRPRGLAMPRWPSAGAVSRVPALSCAHGCAVRPTPADRASRPPAHRPADRRQRDVHGAAGRHRPGHRAADHGAQLQRRPAAHEYRADVLSADAGDVHPGQRAHRRPVRLALRVPGGDRRCSPWARCCAPRRRRCGRWWRRGCCRAPAGR